MSKMKSISKKLYYWVILLLFAIAGCSDMTQDPNQKFFVKFENVKFDDPNISASMISLDISTFSPNIDISYIVVNKTGRQLVFSSVANPQVFIFDSTNNNWYILENRVSDYNSSSQDCSPIEGVSDVGICTFGVYTPIQPESYPATLRIVTIGDVMQNGEPTGEKIGVFFDVEIPGETSDASFTSP